MTLAQQDPTSPEPGSAVQTGQPGQVAPQAKAGVSGVAIAGFILAILFAPLGLILSIIGLVTTGRGKKRGRGLAVAGLVISLLITGGTAAIVAWVASKVPSTVADPGCTIAKSAIFDNDSKLSNPDTYEEALQATIAGLAEARDKAKNSDVRKAVEDLHADYTQLLNAVNSNTMPPASLEQKLEQDATAFDNLCSVSLE